MTRIFRAVITASQNRRQGHFGCGFRSEQRSTCTEPGFLCSMCMSLGGLPYCIMPWTANCKLTSRAKLCRACTPQAILRLPRRHVAGRPMEAGGNVGPRSVQRRKETSACRCSIHPASMQQCPFTNHETKWLNLDVGHPDVEHESAPVLLPASAATQLPEKSFRTHLRLFGAIEAQWRAWRGELQGLRLWRLGFAAGSVRFFGALSCFGAQIHDVTIERRLGFGLNPGCPVWGRCGLRQCAQSSWRMPRLGFRDRCHRLKGFSGFPRRPPGFREFVFCRAYVASLL